ncbi:MAG: hypothetical protein JWQ85_39 [Mucilaginibacter sp.]|nr:hypothetical protein [Mucilaginibacter sp.]
MKAIDTISPIELKKSSACLYLINNNKPKIKYN